MTRRCRKCLEVVVPSAYSSFGYDHAKSAYVACRMTGSEHFIPQTAWSLLPFISWTHRAICKEPSDGLHESNIYVSH